MALNKFSVVRETPIKNSNSVNLWIEDLQPKGKEKFTSKINKPCPKLFWRAWIAIKPLKPSNPIKAVYMDSNNIVAIYFAILAPRTLARWNSSHDYLQMAAEVIIMVSVNTWTQ